jgi:hypothetical protein
MFLLGKYGTQTTFTFPMTKRGAVDFAQTGDWSPATADGAISKDGGNLVDCTNAAAIVGGSPTRGSSLFQITLTATEMQAAQITLQIVDAATKTVEDQAIIIYTYGNASAKFAADLSDNVRMGLTALPNANFGNISGIAAASDVSTVRAHTDQLTYTNASYVNANMLELAGSLQSPVNLGQYVPAIRTKTDQLTFTNASLVDSAWLQTGSDPSSVPSPVASNQAKLDFVFAHYRNKRTQDGASEKLFKNDGVTVVATKSKTDDTTTLTVGAAT